MGCVSSKQVPVPTTTPLDSTSSQTKGTTATTTETRAASVVATDSLTMPNPLTNNAVVEKITGALEALNQRTSIMDQIGLASQFVKETTNKTKTNVVNKARQLQLIFATPLSPVDVNNFRAPVYPKTKEEQTFIRNAILSNFVFSNIQQAELQTMVMAFEPVSFQPNSIIITQGDTGDYFYVIRHGTVHFLINTAMSQTNLTSSPTTTDNKSDPKDESPSSSQMTATAGQTFGELALLYNAPRAATCRAGPSSVVQLYRVDQITFRTILQTQTKAAYQKKLELVQGIAFLQDKLDPSDVQKFADNLTPRTFAPGQVLVQKGDVGEEFYIIQEGTVQVQDIEVSGKKVEDRLLGPGDYFGERALILQEPRNANCIAASSGIALCLDRETFIKVMGNMQNLILQASDKRLLEALTMFQNTILDPSDFKSLSELIVDVEFPKGHQVFREGHHTHPALYLIREGSVKLTSKSSPDMYHDKILNKGGYFGEDLLFHDTKPGVNIQSEPKEKATYTVTVMEDCIVGMLTLEECRTVFDTSKLGKSLRSKRFESIRDSDITMESLTRHCILGAGTFGQVWLVSRLAANGKDHKAYALKIQSKYELLRHSQAQGVVQEKEIMAKLRHPFIIRLVTTYQDPQRVYMLLGLVQGGELFSQMHKATGDTIPEADAQFYSAGIMEGLGHMHRRHILYRDLKPENVLLDDAGYPVIVDLGFAKYVKEKTYTLCGTPLYIAPEVVLNRGHDKGADHWSLACMIFEMICGQTPFYKEGMDQITLFRAVVKGEFRFPKSRTFVFSDPCKSLISRMLVTDPCQRLGSLALGEKEIFRDAWFQQIDFHKLKRKELKAPWVPKIKDPLDRSNFENWDHLDDKALAKDPPISASDNALFQSF